MIESLLILLTYCPNAKTLTLDAQIPYEELELLLIVSEELFSKIKHIKFYCKDFNNAKGELEYQK